MKKIGAIIITLIAVLSIGPLASPVFASSAEQAATDIDNAVYAVMEAAEGFIANTETAEDDETFSAATRAFEEEAGAARDELLAVAESARDSKLKSHAKNFAAYADEMIVAAGGLEQAFIGYDDEGFSASADDFNYAYDALYAETDAFAESLAKNPFASGDVGYALWFSMLFVSIGCLAVAIVVLIATRKLHGTLPAPANTNKKPITLKELRRGLILSAGLFVIGAAIPAIQYYVGYQTHAYGEEFTIRYFGYPLLVGAAWFVYSIIKYPISCAKLKNLGMLVNAEYAGAGAPPEATQPETGQPQVLAGTLNPSAPPYPQQPHYQTPPPYQPETTYTAYQPQPPYQAPAQAQPEPAPQPQPPYQPETDYPEPAEADYPEPDDYDPPKDDY